MPTFITGAAGFVGLALTEQLLGRGEDVVGFDLRPPPALALESFAALPGRLHVETGDVRAAGALRAAMQRHRPRRLVMLAAITADARRERAAPQSVFEVNVGGVLASLSAAADAGVQRVVHASSGAAYGASGAGREPLREDGTPLRPEGLYGISKQAAEAAAQRFASLAGLDLVIGRLGTCFGPWEADTGVRDTPSAPWQVLRRARAGQAAVLPRPGLRDWLYVRDAAAGLAALLDTPTHAHPVYNVAAGFTWTVAQWCERLAARHPDFRWRIAGPHEPANIDYYAAHDRAPMDAARLRQHTGFEPRYDLGAAAHDFEQWLHHA
jgi:UDP-glucuronate 4-epimerase